MAFYYFKNGGTATGDGGRTTTLRTGTWTGTTSQYYDCLFDIFAGGVPTTAPVAGDIVIGSHLHNKAYTANTTLGVQYANIISVDNANQDQYRRGAKETAISGTHDLTISSTSTNRNYSILGLDFEAGDDLRISSSAEGLCIANDCRFEITGTNQSDSIGVGNADGAFSYFNNCIFEFTDDDQSLLLTNGSAIKMNDISLLGTATKYLFESAGNGGHSVEITNSDLSQLTTALTNAISITSADSCKYEVHNVKFGSAIPIFAGTWNQKGSYYNASSIGSDDENYSFEYENWNGGKVVQDLAVYRTNGSEYVTGSGYSAEFIANSNNSIGAPLSFEIWSQYIDTADYTTDITFKVFCARDDGTLLQDHEFWFEVEYPDGLNNVKRNISSNRSANILTGSDLTNESGGWTHTFTGSEGTDYDFMSLSSSALTIGSSAGNIASGLVTIRVYFSVYTGTAASDSVFVCLLPEIS